MLSHTKTYTSTLSRLRPFSLSFRLLHQHANVQSCVPFRASHTLIIGFRVHTHTHTHTHTRTHTHTHPSCICCDPARTNKRYSFTAKHWSPNGLGRSLQSWTSTFFESIFSFDTRQRYRVLGHLPSLRFRKAAFSRVYVCMRFNMRVCQCVRACVRLCACMCMYTYVCLSVSVYAPGQNTVWPATCRTNRSCFFVQLQPRESIHEHSYCV